MRGGERMNAAKALNPIFEIIGLLALSGVVARLTKDYFSKNK